MLVVPWMISGKREGLNGSFGEAVGDDLLTYVREGG